MADAGHGPLKAVPFPVTNPERIPVQRYYDEEFFKLECELLWPRVWQMACRLEEIPEIGDWVEYKILEWSIIVIRSAGGVKAFHNTCRHRGVQLASGGHGTCEVQGFQCPFHGWRWNMEGESTFVFKPELFSDEQLDPEDLDLVPCRVELWGGCAFINMDPDAAPLMEHIQPYADRLDTRNIGEMKMEWWVSTILPTNWKLAMEAFMEGYHTMRTHPQLVHPTQRGDKAVYGPREFADASLRLKPYKTSREMVENAIHQMKTLSIGMGGMIHATDIAVAEAIKDEIELPEDIQAAEIHWYRTLNDEITKRARARGVAIPDLNEAAARHMISPVQFCFPHYFLLPVYGNASSYRIRPLTPETCLFELYSLTLMPEGHKQPRLTAPEPIPHDDPRFPPIPLQDYSNLPLQQIGLHGRGFEYMRLARDVEGLISNYHRLIDGFLSGVEQDKLTAATRIVSSPFEVAIDDIGF
jgi:phenylpropionate dioxygenase-like ring-hydroxylating dioxygenase large terminal subunit